MFRKSEALAKTKRRILTAENGESIPKQEICEELHGEQEVTMTDTQQDTSAQGKTPKSSLDIQKRMKDGEEPTEVLLSLVSSPLIDLQGRALAKILTAQDGGRKVVLAIFYDSEWVEGSGIVSTLDSVGKNQSVGKSEAA